MTCFGLTVLIDMVVAVAVGVGLATALFIRRMAKLTQARRLDAEAHDLARGLPHHRVAVYAIDGPLFFGAAEKAVSTLRTVDADIEVVMLDMRGVPSLDATAIVALHTLIDELHAQHVGLILFGLSPRLFIKLKREGIRREAGRLALVRNAEHARRLALRWLAPSR